MQNYYRCNINNIQTLAESGTEAKKSLNCVECQKNNKKNKIICYGPKMVNLFEPEIDSKIEKEKSEKVPENNNNYIPGMTSDIDDAIRSELKKLGSGFPDRGMAQPLIFRYNEEIRLLRLKKHGWQAMAKIFRKHGLHVGENTLKKFAEFE